MKDKWEIYDSQVTELPGFDLAWLPPEGYTYVTPHLTRTRSVNDVVSLEAGPYVGTLPLRNGQTLYIVPRVGRASFSRMILLTEGLTDAIRDEFDDLARLSDQVEASLPWVNLLARPFISQLRLIEKYSLMPGRERAIEHKNHIKGKIVVIPTLIDIARAVERPVHCIYNKKSFMTIENRTLGTAAAVLLSLGLIPTEARALISRWIRIAENTFIRVDELKQVTMGLQSRRYTGYRSYYIPALLMAKIILTQSGIRLDSTQQIESEPLLTNLPLLFEKYVRAVLATEFAPQGYVVEKITHHARSLFLDGTCQLEPDILISNERGIRLICDTKYKIDKAVSADDYYQIFAYLDAFNTQNGLLILPIENVRGEQLIRRDLPSGKHIFELRLPLYAWDQAEAILRETVGLILNQ